MAADGSRGPRPYTQHRMSTLFLRVPDREWAAVSRGYKTEFRAGGRDPSQLWQVPTPIPVVAYRIHHGRYDAQLMLLERVWQERLIEIGPESLQREGHESFASFRKAWIARERQRFRPEKKVFVYRIRPITQADVDASAVRMFNHLYGDFYEPGEGAPRLLGERPAA
jgi:hypothetical protein